MHYGCAHAGSQACKLKQHCMKGQWDTSSVGRISSRDTEKDTQQRKWRKIPNQAYPCHSALRACRRIARCAHPWCKLGRQCPLSAWPPTWAWPHGWMMRWQVRDYAHMQVFVRPPRHQRARDATGNVQILASKKVYSGCMERLSDVHAWNLASYLGP